jgi:hypothetical protein
MKLLQIAKQRLKVAVEYTVRVEIPRSSGPVQYPPRFQKLVRTFVAEQENMTKLVLEVAQAEANLAALNAHVTERSAKLNKLMQDTRAGASKFTLPSTFSC